MDENRYEYNTQYSVKLEVTSRVDCDFSTLIEFSAINEQFVNGLIDQLVEIKRKLHEERKKS